MRVAPHYFAKPVNMKIESFFKRQPKSDAASRPIAGKQGAQGRQKAASEAQITKDTTPTNERDVNKVTVGQAVDPCARYS